MSLKYLHLLLLLACIVACGIVSARATVGLMDSPSLRLAVYAIGSLLLGAGLLLYGLRFAERLKDVGFIQ